MSVYAAFVSSAISAATPEQRARESWLGAGAERNASALLQVGQRTFESGVSGGVVCV